ncbi:MAG: hypothetical protein A2504_15955 [Bdellovibrionales bacterium RIFOXYD12_FULL_39_22]|nr:MAG: hypothetical protein A2385_07865 [Bdellovibrionales bacterium RIFOXYB1_FULL_39_21]OFZ43024.1 MAG: hypothetical protein A2485_11360 [Bdellovibrionales bacterium RIFOXYC12_FULL_39_17]OFZ50890.1 MAG: hypothetical protein A2404_06780 [Bdellovibrionales bacterium RIFOXYC1_FULL_39_130]OFZ71290.1 MAG: hypothetical protein A2451_14430 [Bdellovibrionales bacterium RIFOXYC2_FULL_39_8]OFZ78113.1 MAG: hypothetical protein A2560_01950 [Bdellovibrionales bacterium RIFOXYD1_FULL_39_84]OFZ93981.1 MAG:
MIDRTLKKFVTEKLPEFIRTKRWFGDLASYDLQFSLYDYASFQIENNESVYLIIVNAKASTKDLYYFIPIIVRDGLVIREMESSPLSGLFVIAHLAAIKSLATAGGATIEFHGAFIQKDLLDLKNLKVLPESTNHNFYFNAEGRHLTCKILKRLNHVQGGDCFNYWDRALHDTTLATLAYNNRTRGEKFRLIEIREFFTGDSLDVVLRKSIRQIFSSIVTGDEKKVNIANIVSNAIDESLGALLVKIGDDLRRYHTLLNSKNNNFANFDFISSDLEKIKWLSALINKDKQFDKYHKIIANALSELISFYKYVDKNKEKLIPSATDAHNDLHMSHIIIGEDQRVAFIDPQIFDSDGIRPQSTLVDLVSIKRSIEYFSYSELQDVVAKMIPPWADKDEIIMLLLNDMDFSSSSKKLQNLILATSLWMEKVESLISNSYGKENLRIFEMICYYSRLLKELEYNYSYNGRGQFKYVDISYLLKNIPTSTQLDSKGE